MSRTSLSADRPGGVAGELLLDRLCDEFEDRWKAGQLPRIEDYLARADASLHALLARELVAIEAFQRRRRGETIPIDEFEKRFPELSAAALQRALEPPVAIDAYDSGESPTHLDIQGDTRLSTKSGAVTANLGDYELIEEIARGGMGVVFRARDIAFDREVAVKLLQGRFEVDSEIAGRFRDEARITGQLQHPSIPAVHRCGLLADGRPFLAMKLIKGRTLAELLDDRSSPEVDRGRFLTILEHVVQAVAYAHSRQVIHRDLKPGNVMVGAFGEVQVMDWGLAKVINEDQRPTPPPTDIPPQDADSTEIRSVRDPDSATQVGMVFGTPAFMAPEQAAGELENIGPASDVFGLGAILCVILTGRPPYHGSNLEAIQLMAVRGNVDAAFAALDGCGAEREWIDLAKQCLAAKLLDRPRDAGVLAAKIADLRSKLEQRARQAELEHAEAIVREAERRKRRRIWGVTAAGVIGLLLVLAGASSWAAGVFRLQRNRLDVAKREATEKLWRSKLEEARALSLSRRPGQRENALVLLREALMIAREHGLTDEDKSLFRNVATTCFTLPDVVEEKSWEATPGPRALGHTFDFDAAFEIYARSDARGSVSIHRVSDHRLLAMIPDKGALAGVYLSPNGKYVAIASDRLSISKPVGIFVYERGEAEVVKLIHQASGFSAVAFRGDSRALLYVGADGRPTIFDLEPQQVRHLPGLGKGAFSASFSPGGERIALCQEVNGRWMLQIRQSDTGEVVAAPLPAGHCSHAWHPNGRILAYNVGDDIKLWDTVARKELAVLIGHKFYTMTMAFDASGDHLLSIDWDGILRIWDVRSGKQQLILPALGGKLVVGSDFGRFAVTDLPDDRRFRIMRLVSCNTLQAWLSSDVQTRVPAMSRKDNVLALGASRSFRLLHTETGRVFTFPSAGSNTYSIGFDSEGALFTSGDLGFCRWPRYVDSKTRILRFGPPQRLLADRLYASAISADGSMIAAVRSQDGLVIWHRERISASIKIVTDSPMGVAVSPDGQFVAGRLPSYESTLLRVWNAQSGKLICELSADPSNVPSFSSDGRWLSCSGNGGKIWRVGSWETMATYDGNSIAVSPDGELCAIGDGVGTVQLVHVATQAKLARLSVNNDDLVFPLVFHRDSSRLYAVGQQSRQIIVWDLRLLREQLAELGLDWDLPRPNESARATEPISSIEFDTGAAFQNFDAERFLAAQKYKEAIAKLDESLAIDPTQADIFKQRAQARLALKQVAEAAQDFRQFFTLKQCTAGEYDKAAWQLATIPGAPSQSYRPALEFANAALSKEPFNRSFMIAKGAALFRLGAYAEALKLLRLAAAFDLFAKEKNVDYIGYLTTMCLNRLADRENRDENRRLARQTFDQTESPRKARNVDDPILASLRQEAFNSFGK